MKKHQWVIALGLVVSLFFNIGSAGDDNPKLERVVITALDTEALTLVVADTSFWVNAKTKMEDTNSNSITLSDFNVGDVIEIWYDELQRNEAGFAYASKIEIDD